jgi:Superfamily I DNA and RNA helicases
MATILAALADPLRARYPDADIRLAAWSGSPTRQRAGRRCTTRWSSWRSTHRCRPSDLAGPPRQDDDFLVISTVHSAKGLEWPVVHLPHLVDGAVPSDMALGSPAGLAEERRLFYVAVTRARDQLFLYAPLRLHHHRLASDDRHGYGQLSRFLGGEALAACESVQAEPPRPCCPAPGSWPRGSTRISARCGPADLTEPAATAHQPASSGVHSMP